MNREWLIVNWIHLANFSNKFESKYKHLKILCVKMLVILFLGRKVLRVSPVCVCDLWVLSVWNSDLGRRCHNHWQYGLNSPLESGRPQPISVTPWSDRLKHSPSLVALGLSVEYETWPPIGWHHHFVIAWFRYIGWDWLVSQYIVGSRDRWEFLPFIKGHWQSPCIALTAGNCLPLRLCKGTVKSLVVRGAGIFTHEVCVPTSGDVTT